MDWEKQDGLGESGVDWEKVACTLEDTGHRRIVVIYSIPYSVKWRVGSPESINGGGDKSTKSAPVCVALRCQLPRS